MSLPCFWQTEITGNENRALLILESALASQHIVRASSVMPKTVAITNLDSTNSASKFGFYAKESLGTINVIGPTKFKYNAALPLPQEVDDFEVMIV